MVEFVDAVAGGLKQSLCGILAVSDAATRAIDGFGIPAGPNIAAGLRRQLCNGDPSTDPPIFPPPFTGGQCPVTYNQRIEASGDGVNYVVVTNLSLTGPLVSRTIVQTGSFTYRLTITNTAGNVAQTNQNALGGLIPRFGQLVRADGLADNCGNPPPVRPTDRTNPIDIDITFDTDIGPTTVNLTGIYSPIYLDLDGSFKADVNLSVGDVNFTGNVNLSPNFEVNIRPSGGNGPGTVDDPDVEDETTDPADPPPEPEEGTLPIVGVLVFSSLDEDVAPTGILFPNGPNIYVPRVASVQFAIKTQNSIAWTSDLDVKNLECYVPCPAPQGAIAVRVSPQPGVSLQFSPVRANPLSTF